MSSILSCLALFSITTTQYAQRAGTEVASGYGSGFVYSADGLIATNNHVVEGAGRIYVTLNGDEQQYEAEIVATDSYSDLAILKSTRPAFTRQVRLFQQPKAGRYGLLSSAARTTACLPTAFPAALSAA